MFELAPGQHWTPFLEEVNDLMLEEKTARHEGDAIKGSEICTRIVSISATCILSHQANKD